MGQREFDEKYHLEGGILLDRTLCKIYGLKKRNLRRRTKSMSEIVRVPMEVSGVSDSVQLDAQCTLARLLKKEDGGCRFSLADCLRAGGERRSVHLIHSRWSKNTYSASGWTRLWNCWQPQTPHEQKRTGAVSMSRRRTSKSVQPRRGDIFYADLRNEGNGGKRGCRPVVIIQNDKGNVNGNSVIVAVVTSAKKETAAHSRFPWQTAWSEEAPSIATLEDILTIDKRCLSDYLGTVINTEADKYLDRAIRISLGLERV